MSLRELLRKEPVDLTNSELIEVLTDSYKATDVPPCRICGGKLSVQRSGGGEPTVYACSGQEEDPQWLGAGGGGRLRYKPGRKFLDPHYSESQWVDYRQGGDERVMELIRRFQAPVDMALFCPACGMRHVDGVDERTPDWKNEPHRSHLCRPEHGGCGIVWRPADVATNGVAELKTQGKADVIPAATAAPAQLAKVG